MAIIRNKFGTPYDHQIPFAVDPVDQSSRVTAVISETVTLVVASTNANDAGSAAGTIVYGRLVNNGVLDSVGIHIGTKNDTSLSFTSTAFTTEVVFPYEAWDHASETTRTQKLDTVVANSLTTNGDYCVDYRTGLIVGKKASTETSLTSTAYKYRSTLATVLSGGGGSEYQLSSGYGSNDYGQGAFVARKDTSGTIADADGDYTLLQVNSAGDLRITLDSENVAVTEASAASILTATQAVQTASELIRDDADTLASAVKTDDAISAWGGKAMAVGGTVDDTSPDTVEEGDFAQARFSSRRAMMVSLDTAIAGEDLTNNVLKTERQYSYSAVAVVDTQVKASAGFLHTVTISCNDAAPTAGTLIIYDNIAESGTVVFNHTFTTTPFVPFTVVLDYVMATGIYLGFATVADVNVSCSYR